MQYNTGNTGNTGNTDATVGLTLPSIPVESGLENEIVELATHISAATCRLIGLIGEFDQPPTQSGVRRHSSADTEPRLTVLFECLTALGNQNIGNGLLKTGSHIGDALLG